MQIAFIGLGNMGAPMAQNLQNAGHRVCGYDVASPSVEGITMAASIKDAVKNADCIITMLPSGAIMRDVITTLMGTLEAPTLLIDCSTVDVESARQAASLAKEHAHAMLDAPVSGGTGGAQAGTLTFMVGGEADTFAKAQPILQVMGQTIFHCGNSGAGQAAKICNNMILGVSMIATCEAFALADGLGLDRQALYDVVSVSSGQSWSMTTYCPAPGVGPRSPADNDYKPGFSADLMTKDLTLADQAAQAAHITTPLGEHARQMYEAFLQAGGAGRDFSAMLEHLTARKP